MEEHRHMAERAYQQAQAVLSALDACGSQDEQLTVIRDALADGYEYRAIAYYLADCHAASYESLPKSAAKSSRKRLADICKTAAIMLKSAHFGRHIPGWHGWDGYVTRVCERLDVVEVA